MTADPEPSAESSELRASAANSRFISVIAHELRGPMTSIKGYTDLILQGAVGEINPRQREFLEIVRANVDRMGDLVSDLLDISRIEAGRLSLATTPVSLAAHLDQVLIELKPAIQSKRQELSLEIPEDLPQVIADSSRLLQVLGNLIGNAWRYTPEGGAVRLRAAAAGGFVRVEVEDTGIGIGPEDRARLFEPFFRSEDPAVREHAGWGLGLSLSRHLVARMGGEIGVESEAGKGSVFWFTLPAAE
ncbi:MAG TPA: HAMP domain-containing sensor histidine kinase [Anaerolineales bacterium]|nr:HAMP domain-containing sensor histidine kinase [Anaerolineales bacterium]